MVAQELLLGGRGMLDTAEVSYQGWWVRRHWEGTPVLVEPTCCVWQGRSHLRGAPLGWEVWVGWVTRECLGGVNKLAR